MVERQMRTLKDQLIAFTDKYQRNWDEYLGLIAGMYRMQVNSATGDTPIYLIYGREPEMPHDTHIQQVATKSNLVQYVKNMVVDILILQLKFGIIQIFMIQNHIHYIQ
jgi:hypothetical protein